MEEAAFSHILDGIYDAATSFERMPLALERLGNAFGCSYVGLIDRNLRTMEARATAVGIDPVGQREYFEVWGKHDLLRRRTRDYRPGAVETDQDILPRSELVRSDYYNGFLKRYDMHAVMRMTLAVEHEFLEIISLSRPSTLGDFDASDVEACRRCVPHLQRAARIARQIEESRLILTAVSDALEQSATGVLLLDRTGNVRFANRAARAMAEAADGFLLRRGRIEALDRREGAALERLIGAATGRLGHADAARGGVMRLSRSSGKPGFTIAAAPMAGGNSLADMRPAAFIVITDPRATPMRPKMMIAELFGLSAAETRVAERLMMGDGPEEAAAALDIKISTVRWHLASLYRKTGAPRQAQLVRLLLSVPAI